MARCAPRVGLSYCKLASVPGEQPCESQQPCKSLAVCQSLALGVSETMQQVVQSCLLCKRQV